MADSMLATSPPVPEGAEQALEELLAIREEMLTQSAPDDIFSDYQDSAVNLLHYLVVRRRDVRPLHDRLAQTFYSDRG